MPKYRVKSLYVGGLKRKIFRPGDIVTEENFPEGRAAKLAEEGHIELISEAGETVAQEVSKPVEVKKDTEEIVIETDPKVLVKKKIKTDIEGKTYTDFTGKEIKKMLELLDVEFKGNSSKKVLFDLLSSNLTD